MGDWASENFSGSSSQGRSRCRRPPHSPVTGCGEATVPSWEKKFCYSACSIPWRKLLEMKKMISYYPNVVQWDDSAGKEAFQNAKARFWAELNHLPCDVSPPDPDIYLNRIDWNCHIDPNLVSDLNEPLPPINDEDGGVILGIPSASKKNQSSCGWGVAEVPVRPSGWGDAEDLRKPSGWGDAEAQCIKPTGWGDAEAHKNKQTGWGSAEKVSSNGWDTAERARENCDRHVIGHEGWNCKDDNKNNNKDGWNGGGWNNRWEDTSSGWQQWGVKNNQENVEDRRNAHLWNARDWSSGRGASYNHRFSRYKVSRYHDVADDYQLNNSGRRNGGSRKRGSVFEKPEAVKQRQLNSWKWNGASICRPGNLNNQGATDAWGWEKPVS